MDLNTRQHTRAAFDASARFTVHLNHRSQVDLVGADATRVARTSDISEGGLSLRSRVYLPRGVLLELEIDDAETALGLVEANVETLQGRVQRCFMTGRQPIYMVAVSFVDLAPDIQARISRYVNDSQADPSISEATEAVASV